MFDGGDAAVDTAGIRLDFDCGLVQPLQQAFERGGPLLHLASQLVEPGQRLPRFVPSTQQLHAGTCAGNRKRARWSTGTGGSAVQPAVSAATRVSASTS